MSTGWYFLTLFPRKGRDSRAPPLFLLKERKHANQIHICFYITLAIIKQVYTVIPQEMGRYVWGKLVKLCSASKESSLSSYCSHLDHPTHLVQIEQPWLNVMLFSFETDLAPENGEDTRNKTPILSYVQNPHIDGPWWGCTQGLHQNIQRSQECICM